VGRPLAICARVPVQLKEHAVKLAGHPCKARGVFLRGRGENEKYRTVIGLYYSNGPVLLFYKCFYCLLMGCTVYRIRYCNGVTGFITGFTVY
jgi:hypothetical protein